MDAELRELCERLRGLLAKVPAGELTAADVENNIGNGMTMHFSVVKRPDGKNIIRLGYTDPYVHLFAAAVNALPRLLDTIAARDQALAEWKDRGLHLAVCAVCAEALSDCEVGREIQAAIEQEKRNG